MAERKLNVEEVKTAKGDSRYNIYLKPKDGKESLQVGEHLFMEKTFAEGMEKQGT